MWESDNGCANTPLYIVQGLASEAIMSQFKFTADAGKREQWLKQAWPALDGTANATQQQRQDCDCAGLLPRSGGDGGLPTGHVFVQEAGALFGVKVAADAAAELGLLDDAARHAAIFGDFRAALLQNVSRWSPDVGPYRHVVGMYPGMDAEEAAACCAWGGVDIIYPFPLVNASSDTARASMAYWSSPNRTDAFGLHLRLGYSQKAWAYLSSDLGHIHLLQGNHSGAMRVLRAMVDNASPTVGTYEEFETGEWNQLQAANIRGGAAKRSWGGIPDMWFTSEVMNLLRDSLVREVGDDGRDRRLSLWHAAPPAWRVGDALSMRSMPTRFGVSVSAEARWGSESSNFSISLEGGTADDGLLQIEMHVGSCGRILATTQEESLSSRCKPNGIAMLVVGTKSCTPCAASIMVWHV